MVFTSLFMYLSEAGLFWLMVLGLWRVVGLFSSRVLRPVFPSVSVVDLRRWALWQVVFVAGWSVVFKLSLPVWLRSARGPLFHGGSQVFAGSAELVGVLFALWAMARIVMRSPAGVRLLFSKDRKGVNNS